MSCTMTKTRELYYYLLCYGGIGCVSIIVLHFSMHEDVQFEGVRNKNSIVIVFVIVVITTEITIVSEDPFDFHQF